MKKLLYGEACGGLTVGEEFGELWSEGAERADARSEDEVREVWQICDPRFAWLMRRDRDMPFFDWVEAVQSDGTAESSYILYTERMATLYALPMEQRVAAYDAVVEEMLVHRHRPLPPELEAVIAPLAAQMRRDMLKYRWKRDRAFERRWKK